MPITAVPNVLPAPPKQAALVRGYTAPRLPRAVYAHGVDGKAFQTVMERERRRICLRWLDSANPAIPGQVALAVLDTERWVGGWKVGGGGRWPLIAASSRAAQGPSTRCMGLPYSVPNKSASNAAPPAGRRL